MHTPLVRRWLVTLAVAVSAAGCGKPTAVTLAVGSPAPSFSLPGIDGKTHTLSEYASSPVLVVVFTCNHCPAAQLYEQRIQRLHTDYRSRGVVVVAINPDSPETIGLSELAYSDVPDSLEGMKTRAAHRRLEYPYLHDGATQDAAKAFKVTALPQAFVFDAQRALRYVGRIDDNLEPGKVTSQDLRAAVDAVLAGQAVKVAATDAVGCAMKWRGDPASPSAAEPVNSTDKVELQAIGAEGLTALRRNGTDKLRLVNFWATWCAPCIIEFPELQTIYQTYRSRNLEFVTVSVDTPDARPGVMKVLQEQRASSDNHVFESDDAARLQDAFDPAMPAAVPFTVLLAPKGDVVFQQLGEANFLALRRAILANLPDDSRYPGLQAYWASPQ
jgi:thiol-disulfide isomerase/thioredoxin